MIVVSDTTAITSLIKIRRIELLRDLFGEALIPKAVRDELLKYHKALPEFLKIEMVKDEKAVSSLREEIDQGEAEAIILAQEIKADVLLIDEKHGRSGLTPRQIAKVVSGTYQPDGPIESEIRILRGFKPR